VSKLELCWGTLERASLIELLGAADRTGYDRVAVSPHSYLRPSARRARAVRSFLASHPLRVHVVDAIIGGLPGSPPARSGGMVGDLRQLPRAAFDDAAGVALRALRAVIGDAATIEPGTI
jgi:hypothetical protein